ncbi:hypothetical protein Mucpa_1482 [Mucilaginibacter paludis DSM 18603]|uniref:Uncharacterized protein n=1 Tax=Mucilaginibacter paludis DSM 18603 TaxID=714943 RepID=H1XZF2_9SPHI|nr:hypothetical protein Mucpa_1482 [Mucilaginibacter paludis DSM 18603]
MAGEALLRPRRLLKYAKAQKSANQKLPLQGVGGLHLINIVNLDNFTLSAFGLISIFAHARKNHHS